MERKYLETARNYNDEYIQDDTIGKKDSGLMGTMLVAGAVGAIGLALVRSGAAKGLIEDGIKKLAQYERAVPEALNTMKQWTKGMSDDIPAMSLFRQKSFGIDTIKNLAKLNSRVIEDTWRDLKQLHSSVEDRIQQVSEEINDMKKRTYESAELIHEMNSIDKITTRYVKETTRDQSVEAKRFMTNDMIKTRTLNAKQREESLKQTGYRPLVLGDILQASSKAVRDGEKGLRSFHMNPNSPLEMNQEQADKFLERLNRDFQATKDEHGKPIIQGNSWENVIVDNSILINEKGNHIADLRGAKQTFSNFMVSAANDFGIPLIHINPIKLFGIHEPFMGNKLTYVTLNKGTRQVGVEGLQEVVEDGVKKYVAKKTESDYLYAKGKLFKWDEEAKKFARHDEFDEFDVMQVHDKNEVNYGLPKNLNLLRRMTGLKLKEFQDYNIKTDGFVKGLYSKAMRGLDIGFQDTARHKFSIDDIASWPNLIGQLGDTYLKPYKHSVSLNGTAGPTGEAVTKIFGVSRDGNEPVYVAVRKSRKFSSIWNAKDKEGMEQASERYFSQYTAGRHDSRNITNRTLNTFFLVSRMDEGLGTIGLGMNLDHTGSIQDLFKNFILKRALPVYLGVQALRYADYESEKHTGETAKAKISHQVVKLDLGYHSILDKLKIPEKAKKLKLLTPGNEQITEVPGLGWLDMTQTKEEREEFYKKGEVAIRKGRWWSLGNTPFTGGKTEYFAPNWYRRTIANYDFTDAKYGSYDEYFKNAVVPTLEHPLAPIRHFFIDPYHYEKKHYKDRPYLMTSPEFENVPLIGPTLSSTIGKIIKPQLKMHPEYWKSSFVKQPVLDLPNAEGGTVIAGEANKPVEASNVFVVPESDTGKLPLSWNITKKKRDYNTLVYTTPSGANKAVNVPMGITIDDLNYQIRQEAISRVRGAQVVRDIGTTELMLPSQVNMPNSLTNTLVNQTRISTEMAGIYGFSLNTAIGEQNFDNETVVETSGNMNSLNREFWDKDLGGLGGELSEISRRFINKRRKDVTYYNPVDNQMPTWMPGEDYFTDFQHGDPFTKVKRGEMRMPGQGYEAMNNIKDPLELGIGSSFIGKPTEDIVKHFLKQDTITDDDAMDIVETGEKMHLEFQKKWAKDGTLIDSEVQINDKKHNIIGFYDARVIDETSTTGEAIVDIKTISDKGFNNLDQTGPKDYNQKQVNFYLNATHIPVGYLYYVNRDHPDQAPKIFRFGFDQKMLDETLANVEAARNIVRQRLDSGELGRGDMYDYFQRFKILADVAPYSKEYKEYNALMSKVDLTPEQREEVSEIRKQVVQKNQPLRIYPYKFKTAKLQYKTVTVDKKLSNEMFLTKEYGDNPIKLAGVNIGDSEDYDKATAYLGRIIHKGAKLRIGVNDDDMNLVSKDTYRTIKAVVYSHGNNINKTVIDKGYGKENDKDWSAPGVHSRFTQGQIRFGSAWETIAHLDTYVNTKAMQVRSALESYERRDIYGKDFQNWSHPIKDYLKPSVDTNINKPFGIVYGAVIGSLFGKTKYGKIIGAVAGATTVGVGKIYKGIYEHFTHKKWIPKRREKEREMNEYIDVLKFLKYRRLYEEYAHKAMEEEKFDVKKFILNAKKEGQDVKEAVRNINRAKRNVKQGKTKSKDVKKDIHDLNQKLEHLRNERSVRPVPKFALRALEYYNKSEQTMYGYDKGEPLENILMALPKKERQYMKYFVNAPKEDRMKILQLAPRYLRRPLEAAWGMPVEDKVSLQSYFKKHQLPGADWKGWEEDVDMDSVKVKMVRHQGQDVSEYNMWNDDIQKADAYGEIPLPNINVGEKGENIRNKLEDILHGMGCENISVTYDRSGTDINVDIDLTTDKQREIEDYIKNKGADIVKGGMK